MGKASSQAHTSYWSYFLKLLFAGDCSESKPSHQRLGKNPKHSQTQHGLVTQENYQVLLITPPLTQAPGSPSYVLAMVSTLHWSSS